MRFRVRRAAIPQEQRDKFEQFGEQVVALGLIRSMPMAGSGAAPSHALNTIYFNQGPAIAWLREKRDEAECHATRIEILEWAILVFVGLEVVFDVLRLFGKAA